MSVKKKSIDLFNITESNEIFKLRKQDFLNAGIRSSLLEMGNIEDFLLEMIDYTLILNKMINDSCYLYTSFDAISFEKIFGVLYPLILLVYKETVNLYCKSLKIKNNYEKLLEKVSKESR